MSLGRRRRRVVRIVKKRLPTVFICPKCGEEAVRVTIAKDTGKATVMCALCQLKDEFQSHPAAQMIDVYSYFTDRFYGVKDPRAIIPRDREVRAPMAEEEPSEPELAEAPVEAPRELSPAPEEEGPVKSPELSPEPQLEGPTSTETVERSNSPLEEPSREEAPATPSGEASEGSAEEKPPAEEEEPFADIIGSKDKKRYSPNPVQQEESGQTSQSSD